MKIKMNMNGFDLLNFLEFFIHLMAKMVLYNKRLPRLDGKVYEMHFCNRIS